MTKRRWLTAATVASKTDLPVFPWQRGAKTRPAAFRHIQMHVAPRPKAIAARQAGRLIHDEDTLAAQHDSGPMRAETPLILANACHDCGIRKRRLAKSGAILRHSTPFCR